MSVIKSAIDSLHIYRKSTNGSLIGYGMDEYSNSPHHYPEAYARFGSGYYRLFQLTKNPEYKRLYELSANWLLKNRSPCGYGWGLPYGYGFTQACKPYLITTAFCCDLLKDTHPDEARADLSLLLDDLKLGGGLYGYSTGFMEYLPNAVASLLPPLVSISKRETCKEIVNSLITYQEGDGSWNYRPTAESPFRVDNLHTGYILGGLWEYYNQTHDREILKDLIKGTEFYWDFLFRPDGYAKLQRPLKAGDINRAGYNRVLLDSLKPTKEARLRGYAAGLKVFTVASQEYRGYLYRANRIFKYLLDHHLNGDGGFSYRSNDRRYFVRHHAHLFDAFTLYYERKEG